MRAQCEICPHACTPDQGKLGLCRARGNVDGTIKDINYGQITSIALDPIEKKPLARFCPGTYILSVGSYGCNFRCGWCQNNGISMGGPDDSQTEYCSPERLADIALSLVPQGNIGVAYTYNEPLVGYEYVRDASKLIHEAGLKNVIVTNGYINEGPLLDLLPSVDAMNIDLKSFSESFYREIGGNLETVKKSIALSSVECHVEVTTLIVPGRNDSEEEMEALSSWLASVNPDIPLHITRFFPRYRMSDASPTEVNSVLQLTDIARRHLKYVYAGNI